MTNYMKDTIQRLQNWYAAACNGKWEHTWGVKIDTIDNPGWSVIIDLDETPHSTTPWKPLNLDKGPHDWMRCEKKGTQFRGHGDPTKLESILKFFLDNVAT